MTGHQLLEEVRYDEVGQPLSGSGSFMDYSMPRADKMPPLRIERVDTLSPLDLLSLKGEPDSPSRRLRAPFAIEDALSGHGITVRQTPVRPQALSSLEIPSSISMPPRGAGLA